MTFKLIIKRIFQVLVYVFAFVGFVLTVGFWGVRLNLTNVLAVIDKNTDAYQKTATDFGAFEALNSSSTNLSSTDFSQISLIDLEKKAGELSVYSQKIADYRQQKLRHLCAINVLATYAPENARLIFESYQKRYSPWLIEQMVLAVDLRLKDNQNFSQELAVCQTADNLLLSETVVADKINKSKNVDNIFPWAQSDSYDVVEKAILKDQEIIKKTAALSGVNSRMIVSILIVEQLRLYNTQRELFEKFFKPLEILASANKMAWGIMAIKEKAAIDIENNLKNSNSNFYPGDQYRDLLNFSTNNPAKERYDRLANEKDHYYSYLYGGLLIKELMAQWQKSGYDVSSRPEVVATLFNIGFTKSKPKANPQVGGSMINIKGTEYTFGSLAHEFYYSGLLPEFGY